MVITPLEYDKFIFNNSIPGVLDIGPCQATTGIEQMDNSIEWSITDIANSDLTDPPPGPEANFIFTGLPVNSDQFGLKTVRADLSGYNMSDFISVRVYYLTGASNHPGGTTPNWFYYWGHSGAVPHLLDSDVDYDPTYPEYAHYQYDQTRDDIILGILATDLYAHESFGDYDFGPVSGIDCTQFILLHEKRHQQIIHNWLPGGEWYNTYGPRSIGPSGNDRDGDMLPNDYETAHGMNPDYDDSFNLRGIFHVLLDPDYGALPDQEYDCFMAAQGADAPDEL